MSTVTKIVQNLRIFPEKSEFAIKTSGRLKFQSYPLYLDFWSYGSWWWIHF